MSIDNARLQKTRTMADGSIQCQCPACAEDGHDRSGNHLRILEQVNDVTTGIAVDIFDRREQSAHFLSRGTLRQD